MKSFAVSIFFILIASCAMAQIDTTQKVVAGRKNNVKQEKKPYLILISADGFRYDYAVKYNATHLLALAAAGVKSKSMLPSYPSVTFPNHYSIVTGLYPSHHGLVNNYFYDPGRKTTYSMSNKAKVADGSWYGGTPLWVLAEQQQMLSASFYWVASEAPIQGLNPTYYYAYNDKIDIHTRITTVVNWLKLPASARPHFITFYFPQVDHAGHAYGPDAPETAHEVLFIDSAVNELNKAVKATGLKVNFIFVSDHGMTRIDNEHPLEIPSIVDTSKFVISGESTLVELYAKNVKYIDDTYKELVKGAKDYKVYLKSNMPAYLHYGRKDDRYNRIGDILLMPNHPKVFRFADTKKITPATHGYDPIAVNDMHATFYAWGPAFKKHLVIPTLQNVDIYPVVTDILKLKDTGKIDGSKKLAQQILVK